MENILVLDGIRNWAKKNQLLDYVEMERADVDWEETLGKETIG